MLTELLLDGNELQGVEDPGPGGEGRGVTATADTGSAVTNSDATGPAAVSSPRKTPASRSCARPGCTNPVVRNPRGRPRLYCSPACRTQGYRDTHLDARHQITVEVDHGSTSSRGRPAGQVWLIRLRRGHQQVIVATGLGRPSADHLANQIDNIINLPPLANPPPTR